MADHDASPRRVTAPPRPPPSRPAPKGISPHGAGPSTFPTSAPLVTVASAPLIGGSHHQPPGVVPPPPHNPPSSRPGSRSISPAVAGINPTQAPADLRVQVLTFLTTHVTSEETLERSRFVRKEEDKFNLLKQSFFSGSKEAMTKFTTRLAAEAKKKAEEEVNKHRDTHEAFQRMKLVEDPQRRRDLVAFETEARKALSRQQKERRLELEIAYKEDYVSTLRKYSARIALDNIRKKEQEQQPKRTKSQIKTENNASDNTPPRKGKSAPSLKDVSGVERADSTDSTPFQSVPETPVDTPKASASNSPQINAARGGPLPLQGVNPYTINTNLQQQPQQPESLNNTFQVSTITETGGVLPTSATTTGPSPSAALNQSRRIIQSPSDDPEPVPIVPQGVTFQFVEIPSDSQAYLYSWQCISAMLHEPFDTTFTPISVHKFMSKGLETQMENTRLQLHDPNCERLMLAVVLLVTADVQRYIEKGVIASDASLFTSIPEGRTQVMGSVLLCEGFLGLVGHCSTKAEVPAILKHYDSCYVQETGGYFVSKPYQVVPRAWIPLERNHDNQLSHVPREVTRPIDTIAAQDRVEDVLKGVTLLQRTFREKERELNTTTQAKREMITTAFNTATALLQQQYNTLMSQVEVANGKVADNLRTLQASAALVRSRATTTKRLIQDRNATLRTGSHQPLDIEIDRNLEALTVWESNTNETDYRLSRESDDSLEALHTMKLDISALTSAITSLHVLGPQQTSSSPFQQPTFGSEPRSTSGTVVESSVPRPEVLSPLIESHPHHGSNHRSMYQPPHNTIVSSPMKTGNMIRVPSDRNLMAVLFNTALEGMLSSGKSISWMLEIQSASMAGVSVGVAVGAHISHWIGNGSHDPSHMFPLPIDAPNTLVIVVDVVRTRAQLKVLDTRGRVLDASWVPPWNVTRPAYPQVTFAANNQGTVTMVNDAMPIGH